jgi:hypothetical protein
MIFTAEAVPQLLLTEYDIGVVPALMPVTMPPVVTVALVFPALQVPPAVGFTNVIAEPMHTLSAPLVVPAFGSGFTVISMVVLMLPQLPLTV